MPDPTTWFVVACGMSVGLAVLFLVLGLRPRTIRLDDALALLAGDTPEGRGATAVTALRANDGDLPTRMGAWVFTHLRLPLGENTRRTLSLQGRSIGDFFAEKLILGCLGLAVPVLASLLLQGLGATVSPTPVVVSLAVAAAGWLWPDVALRRAGRAVKADAGEALFTFLDLVTLERLANASAAQALMSAATLSDIPLFVRLRTSLQRARLEQRPPWHELRRLSRELDLPQIADVADVMKLDEQGAALADALRARVKELRDAHLLGEKIAAQQVSERMTLWMVLPSMIFGLVFLTPPILRLLGITA